MKQVTLNYKSNELALKEVPPPALQPGFVRVRAAYSAISLGTEGMKVTRANKGLIAMARERPDQVRQVMDTFQREGPVATYNKVMNKLDTPNPLGYSLSGIVDELGEGVSEFAVGDRVACAGEGFATHAELVSVPKNLCVKVPEGVGLDSAAFATLGAIAMQGVRQSGVGVGDRVVIIGLGLVGQIAAQICRAAGCRVFGVDLDQGKCDLLVAQGGDGAVMRSDPFVEEQVLKFTDGLGADAVIVAAATASTDPAQLAVTLVRDRGTVVLLGIVGVEFGFEQLVKKEVQIKLSRSYGPGRYDPQYEMHGIDYPIGYVRWTEQRNMESFLDLIAGGKLKLDQIITHRFPFSEAEAAYAQVLEREAGQVMGILFEYQNAKPLEATVRYAEPKPAAPAALTVGVIGAGNFSRATLLPALKNIPGIQFRAVANATGLSSGHTAARFGFSYATGDYQELLADDAINLVVVSTRHDSHAALTAASLKAGKAVFVEKPLAATREQLAEVVEAWQQYGGRVMVGFNRRFAPATQQVKQVFARHAEPLVINYRVNAGFLAADHWLQDPTFGGGRLIGEGCHFVDWMRYLVGAPIVAVSAMAADNNGRYQTDNVVAQYRFADGSVGNMMYVANGGSRLPKEYIEVHGQRASAIVDDYREVTLYVKGKEEKLKLTSQDKGHAAEIAAVAEAVQHGGPMPIPFFQLVEVTEAIFATLDSIATGNRVAMPVLS